MHIEIDDSTRDSDKRKERGDGAKFPGGGRVIWCQQTRRKSYKSPVAPPFPFRFCYFYSSSFLLDSHTTLLLLGPSRLITLFFSFNKLPHNHIHHGSQESHQRVFQEGGACCSRLLPRYVLSDLGPPQHRVKMSMVSSESRTSADSIHIDMIKDAIVNVSRSLPAPGLL